MMRRMRGRWFWGILGAAATIYFLRRSRDGRQDGPAFRMGNFTSYDAAKMGRSAVDTLYRAGSTLANNTMRAISRQRS